MSKVKMSKRKNVEVYKCRKTKMSKDKMSTETSACFFIKYVKDEGEGDGEGEGNLAPLSSDF